jgi:hypothetical protein
MPLVPLDTLQTFIAAGSVAEIAINDKLLLEAGK